MIWVDPVHGGQPYRPKELYLMFPPIYSTGAVPHEVVEKSRGDETG